MTSYSQEYADLYREFKENYIAGFEQAGKQQHNPYQLSGADLEKEKRIRAMLNQLPKEKLTVKANELLENQHRPISKLTDEISISTYDLDYIVADSLRLLDAQESPEAEYRDWVVAQEKIESAINTDGTTQQEVDARNGFISFLDTRETEMKRVMELFSAAALHAQGFYKEDAKAKLNYMIFKLSELRRLRTKMQQTKDRSDEQERAEREAINRGMAYVVNKAGHEFEENAVKMEVFKPVSRNQEEAKDKINRLRTNVRTNMRLIMTAYRMGKTKEEIENDDQTAYALDDRDLYNSHQVSRPAGFIMKRFERLNQRESA